MFYGFHGGSVSFSGKVAILVVYKLVLPGLSVWLSFCNMLRFDTSYEPGSHRWSCWVWRTSTPIQGISFRWGYQRCLSKGRQVFHWASHFHCGGKLRNGNSKNSVIQQAAPSNLMVGGDHFAQQLSCWLECPHPISGCLDLSPNSFTSNSASWYVPSVRQACGVMPHAWKAFQALGFGLVQPWVLGTLAEWSNIGLIGCKKLSFGSESDSAISTFLLAM